jgi:hypothetical protein
MARYTGPKTKIARKFGEEQFLEKIKTSKKETFLQDSMVMQEEEVKNLNMLLS